MSVVTTFRKGQIEGVKVRPLKKFVDERGWLCELFRHDEWEPDAHPVMSYLSVTLPGVVRGPHEHEDQSDLFCFIGPSNFKVVMWDNRPSSPTYQTKQVVFAGLDSPQAVFIPPGVVHAYKNVGTETGTVINCPNRLFMGEGKQSPIDEIRHEDDPNSPFQVDG